MTWGSPGVMGPGEGMEPTPEKGTPASSPAKDRDAGKS